MDGTIYQQGNFAADGTDKVIQLRSDVDWMKVFNLTVAGASQTTAIGVEFEWFRGFNDGRAIRRLKSNAANAANLTDFITSGGFTLVDTSASPNGVINATVTAVSNAAIPVVSNSGTNGLAAGDIVRMINVTGAQQLGGLDFTVGYNTLTSGTFSLDYMAQIVAGTTGSWMKIKYDPLYYPRRRYITNITQASSAVVKLSVTHGYKVGQVVRFKVPSEYGMVEMNGLQGTITAINTTTTSGNTITVDINSTNFTAFSFPLTAVSPFTAAQVIPVGMDSGEALDSGVDLLSDATDNTGYIGMILGGGFAGGENGDAMYWIAGKSFSVNNEI